MLNLVTGGSGFIGQWLIRRLLAEGEDVRVLVRGKELPTDSQEATSKASGRIEYATGDITQPATLQPAMVGVDRVFHLAGLIAYSRSQRGAMERVNVEGTRNVLQAAVNTGVKRFLHVSSVSAIGASFDGVTPLNEASEYNLAHLNLGYFETKRKAELIVREAAAQRAIEAVIVNPSTVYGAGDASKGSRNTQLKVARGKFPFYPPGGVSIAEVGSVVDAMIVAIERGRNGERYILSGENLTIHKTFQLIAEAAGVKPPRIGLSRNIIFAMGQWGDWMEQIGLKGSINMENAWISTLYHWFDSSKAQRDLNYRPVPASVAIESSVRWSREQGVI